MIRFGMGLMEIVEQLTRGFIKATGKQPDNLEKLKIQQEAIQRLKEMNKVVDMEGRAMDTTKPIIGGTQRGADLKSGIMKATGAQPREVLSEEQIRQKLINQNKEGLESMKSKLDDPEKKAMGGRIGYKDGEGVITIDDKIDEMISFYKDYLNQGGKMDFKTFSKKYIPENFANGGRIGYAGGNKVVQGLLKVLQNKFGKKAATTANKAPIPPKTLERDMFKKFDNRNPDLKRQLTDEEIEEYEMELGDTETWMNDGTVGEAEAALKNHREYMAEIMRMKERGDFGDFSPSKLDNVNDYQIAAAVDDIFPTGDPKYDAEMASEALVENNPQIFGDNVLLDDLDDATRSKIYEAVYDVLSNNMAKMRELKKLSKPEKTLQSMKEGKGINISDPEIADEFGRFMKETDPKGYKELEQKIELSNFDTKGRKKNADGGRIGLFMGSRPAVQKGLSTLKEMLKYFGKKSDRVKNPSDILKIVNPKRLNKLLEDPNIYRKFDVEKGIAAPDLIKNMQKQMTGDRQKTIEEMLGAAKNIKSADDNIIKYKNEMIEDMLKKGVDRETAEEMAETISKMAKGASGKFDDTPKLTDEGVMQLENILKDMETGGKAARELNATGGRIGYKNGPKMNRRTFMKYLAGFVSLPIIGKIVKPLKTVKGVKNVPIIKTGDVPGKPEWFDALVNKVIIEGDDVTKKFATQDRQVVYTKKIDADNEVTVYRDLDTDSVRVDYSSPDVMLDEPVSLSYTRGQADEATQGMKPADEFETFEQGLAARSNGPDDYSIDVEPNVGSSISSLETDVSKLKEYATGKGPTMKEFVASKKRKDRVKKINEGDIGETSDYVTKKQGDYYDYDDYASGGIARMLGE